MVQLGATAIARPQQKIAAGVRGFAAAEGTIQLPVWLARSLQVDQPGAKVYVEAMPHTALPSAESCCLRATDPRFLALSNARAVLETALSTRFRTLTLVSGFFNVFFNLHLFFKFLAFLGPSS